MPDLMVISNTSPIFYLHRLGQMDLGMGEAQVLAIAIENPGSLVILDDRLAREIANSRNMRVTGTAGIILKAKQEGYIRSVRPIFESLKQLDFWISDALMDNIIRMAGE